MSKTIRLTAKQALAAHNLTFWRAADCDAWMATAWQLHAQLAYEMGEGRVAAAYSYDARQLMGLTDADQLYA